MSTTSPTEREAEKVRAAALLSQLVAEVSSVSALSLAGEAAAQEACRLACRALAGAVVGGEPFERAALPSAALRPDHMGRVPWAAVNRVVEAAYGEDGLERLKQRVAGILKAEARPVASVRKGEPRWSQRFGKPHRA